MVTCPDGPFLGHCLDEHGFEVKFEVRLPCVVRMSS